MFVYVGACLWAAGGLFSLLFVGLLKDALREYGM